MNDVKFSKETAPLHPVPINPKVWHWVSNKKMRDLTGKHEQSACTPPDLHIMGCYDSFMAMVPGVFMCVESYHCLN